MIKLVVDNDNDAPLDVEWDDEDEDYEMDDDQHELYSVLAHVAGEVQAGRVSSLAVVTVASDRASTASCFSSNVAEDLHMMLAAVDLLKDRIKDDCL